MPPHGSPAIRAYSGPVDLQSFYDDDEEEEEEDEESDDEEEEVCKTQFYMYA